MRATGRHWAAEARADHRAHGQGGFTLTELLVVVAILAILGGIAVFAVDGMTRESNEVGCRVERRTLIAAMQAADATVDPHDTFDKYTDSGIKYFDPGLDPAAPVWSTAPDHPGGTCLDSIP